MCCLLQLLLPLGNLLFCCTFNKRSTMLRASFVIGEAFSYKISITLIKKIKLKNLISHNRWNVRNLIRKYRIRLLYKIYWSLFIVAVNNLLHFQHPTKTLLILTAYVSSNNRHYSGGTVNLSTIKLKKL